MIDVAFSKSIPKITSPSFIQKGDRGYLYHLHEEKIRTVKSTEIHLGNHEDLTWSLDNTQYNQDAGVSWLGTYTTIDDAQVYLWVRNGSLRMAIIPFDGSVYSPSDIYRIYQALDTDKMYMNIADTWQFVATKNHLNLENAGTLSHDQLEELLGDVSSVLSNLIGGA